MIWTMEFVQSIGISYRIHTIHVLLKWGRNGIVVKCWICKAVHCKLSSDAIILDSLDIFERPNWMRILSMEHSVWFGRSTRRITRRLSYQTPLLITLAAILFFLLLACSCNKVFNANAVVSLNAGLVRSIPNVLYLSGPSSECEYTQ